MLKIFLTFFIITLINCEPRLQNSQQNLLDKQLILDIHNWYRAQISRGDIFRQPESSDMTVVEWDDRLAEIALTQAGYCRSPNKIDDSLLKRQLSSLDHDLLGKLAINEYFTNDTENYSKKAVYSWFQSHKDYIYDNGTCTSKDCQAYKNMIFSNVFVLGCESQKCGNGISVVCVYSNDEKTNQEKRLYKSGLSCTSCPQDFSFCMDGSLCASKFHCRDSKISKTCRCLVLPELCRKHGDYDSSKCRCRCQPGWTGLNCEKPCQDTSALCEQRKWACSDSSHKSVMFKSCPQTCKWCQNNPNSIPIYNENEIKINTIYDPTNFELDDQSDSSCRDFKMECGAWASKGYCNLDSVKRVCKMTCKICEVQKEKYKTTQQIFNPSNCDDHPTCVADFQPYCNIMIQISLKCPKLCGRCQATSSSSPKFSSTTTMLPTTVKKEFMDCTESPDRKETCVSIAMANLCSKRDMQEHCPITCNHPSCQKALSSSSPSSSTTKQMTSTSTMVSSTTTESNVCKFLPCNEPGVPSFCRNKCSGISTTTVSSFQRDSYEYCKIYPCSLKFVKETCRKCFDPEICISLDCNYNGVWKLCKNKCQTSTPISSSTRSSTTSQTVSKKTDSPLCITLPCDFPDVEKLCPNKCSKSTTLKPSTTAEKSTKLGTTQQTSTKMTESPICSVLQCEIPDVEKLCPKKCQKSTTSLSSDSPLCVSLSCEIPRIELLCPQKCKSSSVKTSTITTTSTLSSISSTPSDPSICIALPCEMPQVKVMCPRKCRSTSTSQSTSFMSTTASTDSPLCVALPCGIPQIELLCPVKCSSTSTKKSTTATSSTMKSSTLLSSSTKQTDPVFCLTLPCSVPQVEIICPIKCLSSTTKSSTSITSAKSTDPVFCISLPCNIPQVNLACPIKCASTTMKSTSSISTKSTDPVFCAALPCELIQVKMMCPNKCLSTTAISSTSISSTEKTDLPLCVFVVCNSPHARTMCPQQCSSTTSKSTMTMTTKSTDSPVCAFFSCNMPQVSQVCPNKCASTISKISSTMTSSTTTLSSTTSMKSSDPEICLALPCSIPAIKVICPRKCMSTTTSLSTSPISSKPTDHPLCVIWPCYHPGFQSLCPNKCSSTSPISTKTTSVKPTDPPFCNNFPCEFPQVKMFCPLKCGSSSSSISTSLTSTTMKSSSVSTGTKPTDFPMCIFVSCDSIEAKMACPVKCGLTSTQKSTPISSLTSTIEKSSTVSETDNPICAQLPCSNAGVQALCKNKCVDNPICKSLPCSNAGVRQLCMRKCADYSTPKSSTPASTTVTISSTIKTTDPGFCVFFSCNIKGMDYACPNKCQSTTTATSTTQTDPTECSLFPCDNPYIKKICKTKCGNMRKL